MNWTIRRGLSLYIGGRSGLDLNNLSLLGVGGSGLSWLGVHSERLGSAQSGFGLK